VEEAEVMEEALAEPEDSILIEPEPPAEQQLHSSLSALVP
jgi:hypothetical protein